MEKKHKSRVEILGVVKNIEGVGKGVGKKKEDTGKRTIEVE